MRQILVALLLALAAPAVYAQAPASTPRTSQSSTKTLEQRAQEITNSMAKHLRLTPEQASKIQNINLTSMQQVEAAQLRFKKKPKKLVQQVDVISQTRLSLIKDVLSPLQFDQYQQRREEKMGVPREAQTNPAAPGQYNQY